MSFIKENYECSKGYYINEAVTELKDKDRRHSYISIHSELPLLRKDKQSEVGFNKPILKVDEKGKVNVDRYWDAVTEGYKRIG
ncbi:MAG: hypothetical protein FH758_03270 [Firmicutes bacterium]|nr:hypothetical protein [Bacillota bacterium]